MNTRSLPLLLFPIIGILLAVVFRTPEVDWETLEPIQSQRIERKTLHMPDGSGLRFITIPGSGFALSVTEVPPSVLHQFKGETASHAGAVAFTEWISLKTGKPLRLPAADEWRRAARQGIANAEFVWGFGPPVPPKGLNFSLESPPRKPGPAFGYGFKDLAGGLWEWTKEGILLGSAWSERDPQTLYIDHQFEPPENYAGEDTGIRVLWEEN